LTSKFEKVFNLHLKKAAQDILYAAFFYHFHNFPAMVYSRAPVIIKRQGFSGHILDFQMAQGLGIDPEPPEIVCEDQ
jgi:hypothetical protein